MTKSSGERYFIPVMIRILELGGHVKFSDLSDIVTTFSTLEKLMTLIEQDKLVVLSRVMRPYKTNFAELTELGREVAADLKRADDRMRGIVGVGNQTDCGASPDPVDPVTHSTGDT